MSLEFCFLQLSTRRRVTFAIRDAHHQRRNKMSFAATDFEYKQRFWIIGAVIYLAFGCYNIDDINVAFALTQKILGPGVNKDSPVFDATSSPSSPSARSSSTSARCCAPGPNLTSTVPSYTTQLSTPTNSSPKAPTATSAIRSISVTTCSLSASESSPAASASSSWSSACSSSHGG